jgi:hypothetical protein
MKDRSDTPDNARRSPRSRTAARRPGAESAVGRSTRFARTLGGLVPFVPAALARGERSVDVPDGSRRPHARPRRSSPNQTWGRASIRGNVCPPPWRSPQGSSVCVLTCDQRLRERPATSAAVRARTTSTKTGLPTGQFASGASCGKTAALMGYSPPDQNGLSGSSVSFGSFSES